MAERRGFTLAETLVALLVFSMALSLFCLVMTNLKQQYQGNYNQQREAQVARTIMSLEAPETGLTLKTCFKRQLILYSKITNKKYYFSTRPKVLVLRTDQGGNMRYLNQVRKVTFVQLSKQRVQMTVEFEEGISVTQEITFYE
ncbi:competence type IV pilus minor pilin ComGF [Weissella confusa]|uniref:competence type IV pilus minor pilin ComGF n=1 Tax=Weissella confusa TaxID=1583 RepID=UPI0035A35ED8